MNIALIKNGVVQNVIVVTAYAKEDDLYKSYDYSKDITGTAVGIGWTYNNDIFQPPDVVNSATIVDTVSVRQLKLALVKHSKLNVMNSVVDGMPGSTGDECRIEWQYADVVRKGGWFSKFVFPSLGLVDEDNLFVTASLL